MVIAFRVFSLVLLGGLVLLWYLDFEPRRLTALADPLFGTSDQIAQSNETSQPAMIERRLEAIEAAVSGIAAGLPPPVDSERLDSRLATLGTRLAAVEEALSQAGTAPATSDVSDLERRISALGEQVAALTGSVAGPDVAAVEARLARIESGLAELAERSPNGFDPASLRREIAEIGAKLDTLVTGPEVARRLTQVALRLDELETRIAGAPDRISAGMAAGEIREEFARVTEHLEALAARPAPPLPESLGQRLAAIEAELARLSEAAGEPVDLAALTDRLEAIDAAVSAIAAEPAPRNDTTGLESQIAALRFEMDAAQQSLQAKIEAIAARPAQEPGTADLEARFAELADRLPATDETASLRTILSEIRAKLDALSARPVPAGVPQDLGERLASVEDQLAAIAQRSDEPVDLLPVSDRLEALNTAMAAIAGRPMQEIDTGELETGIASIRSDMEARFRSLEAEIGAIAARPAPEFDTGDLRARIAELADRLPAAGEAAAVRTSLGQIEQTLDSLAARPVRAGTPEEIVDRLAAIEDDLTRLVGTFADGPDMTAIEAGLQDLDAALTELAERPAPGSVSGALESELDSLEAGLDAKLAALEAHLAEVAARPRPELDTSALEARMAAIGARLGQIEGRLSEADASGLHRQIAAVQTRLDTVAEAIPPSFDSSAIEARLDRIESRLARIGDQSETRAAPATPPAGPTRPAETRAAPADVTIQTTGEAWMRIRDGRRIIFEGLVPGGEQVPVPAGLRAPELRAGNAGSVFILVDGVPYGPLGGPRDVVRDVSLRPPDIRERFPRATTETSPRETAG